jgi:hypothetical protein
LVHQRKNTWVSRLLPLFRQLVETIEIDKKKSCLMTQRFEIKIFYSL